MLLLCKQNKKEGIFSLYIKLTKILMSFRFSLPHRDLKASPDRLAYSLTKRFISHRNAQAQWARKREASPTLDGRVGDEGDWAVLRAV